MEPRQDQAKAQEHSQPTPEKKPYRQPMLKDFGDIRDLTLGSTSGLLESGQGVTFRF